MVFNKHDINISSVDYRIEYDSEKEIATIIPTVNAVCTKPQILIASIHVDDHELRPSLKLVLEEGKRSYVVPYVRIGRPMTTWGGCISCRAQPKMPCSCINRT